MVNGTHIYRAFLTSGHSKCFKLLANVHTPTAVATMQGDSQPVRSSQGEDVSLRDTSTLS